MKRFYKDVTVEPVEAGFAIRLDGRPVRTPARAELALPNAVLAEAVAQEWRDQGETLDPATMAFTGLANAAIDHIAGNRAKFAADIAEYGGTDMLCYRAEGPEAFVARQAAAWDPLLDWARARYDIAFVTTQGIIHVAQPDATLERLAAAVDCSTSVAFCCVTWSSWVTAALTWPMPVTCSCVARPMSRIMEDTVCASCRMLCMASPACCASSRRVGLCRRASATCWSATPVTCVRLSEYAACGRVAMASARTP